MTIKKMTTVYATLIVCSGLLAIVNTTSAEKNRPAAKARLISPVSPVFPVSFPKQDVPDGEAIRITGHWYSGTMTGFDCNLIINRDDTLTVQNGGCFNTDPAIKSAWQLSANKILLSDPRLKRQLGPYLSIARVGKHIVLVPQSKEKSVKRQGYDYQFCFWPNLMGDKGLELPKEAREYDKRRTPDVYDIQLVQK